MEYTRKKDCICEGLVYPHGFKLHAETERIVCKDGEWHSLGEGSEESEPSLAYFYH